MSLLEKCPRVRGVYILWLQEAVARALEVETARLGQPDCYFTQLAVDTERKRDEIAEVLREVGLEPIIPDSGYFMMADTTPLGDSHPPAPLSLLFFIFSCFITNPDLKISPCSGKV